MTTENTYAQTRKIFQENLRGVGLCVCVYSFSFTHTSSTEEMDRKGPKDSVHGSFVVGT